MQYRFLTIIVVFTLVLAGVPAQSRSYTDAEVHAFPEMRRLIAQIDPARYNGGVDGLLALYGHVLGQQRNVIGNDPERQERFDALVDYLARTARGLDVVFDSDRRMIEAFQGGLNGYADAHRSRAVFSIFSDPPMLLMPLGQPQPVNPPQPMQTAWPLDGQYTRVDPCADCTMIHTVTVKGDTVHATVENWGCLNGLVYEITASGARLTVDDANPLNVRLASDPAAGYPGRIIGMARNYETGEYWQVNGDYWFLYTDGMRDFHFFCPTDHFGIDAMLQR